MQTYFPLQTTGVNIFKPHHSNRLKVYLCLHLYCCAPQELQRPHSSPILPQYGWIFFIVIPWFDSRIISVFISCCSPQGHTMSSPRLTPPENQQGWMFFHPDTLIIQRSTSVFSSCRAPCGPPCSHQYSSLKGVRVNTLHSLSFDFTHRLPLLSCLVVHPEDL